jgi:hypothetical protein
MTLMLSATVILNVVMLIDLMPCVVASLKVIRHSRKYKRGEYHCTADLLFDCFGLVCFANKNEKCQ